MTFFTFCADRRVCGADLVLGHGLEELLPLLHDGGRGRLQPTPPALFVQAVGAAAEEEGGGGVFAWSRRLRQPRLRRLIQERGLQESG